MLSRSFFQPQETRWVPYLGALNPITSEAMQLILEKENVEDFKFAKSH